MDASLRPLTDAARRLVALTPVAVLAATAGVPLLGAGMSAVHAGLALPAWRELLADPLLGRALLLSVGTGVAATALSALASAAILARSFAAPPWPWLVRTLAPLLAMPHAAFAIGLVFLIAPSGWLLRLLSPWATGLDLPPAWPTTQDPWGLGLVLALTAKEVPFLLWVASSQLRRADAGQRWRRELDVARTMGYASGAAWWRVVWPQLWPRLRLPLLAVAAYSLTVVDVALVIGPAAPPTAAVLVWQWLLDADPAVNAKGAAGAWLLAAVAGALCLALRLWHGRLRPRRWTDGERGRAEGGSARAWTPVVLLAAGYACVMGALLVGSVSGIWTFPAVWPQALSLAGWRSVADSSGTVLVTLLLGAASAALALAWAVLWLEWAPPRWDMQLRRVAYLPLVLPSILWVVGLHRLVLAWHLDAHWSGLLLAHTLAALPYVLIALGPSYADFDGRYRQLASSLGHGRLVFLLRIKWPLLRAGLWSAAAVGFAVSVAQYLPTLFIGGGRYATVTTEAVTLASGGQRSLLAAFAWLQWVLPAAVFALAAWAGRARRFRARAA